jgi:hypothetical protein
MRLITRGDVDGLACAIFITTIEKIDSIKFIHPKDMQDGLVNVTSEDIICNLPYNPGCAMWFDHHVSEGEREENVKSGSFKGKYDQAPSAARLVYEYYNDSRLDKYKEFLEAVDKMDSATLDIEDVTNPKGWMLLLYSLDPRTSIGDFKYYFFQLIDLIKTKPLKKIMKDPEVALRCDYVSSEQSDFKQALLDHTKLDGNVIVTDFRDLDDIPMGNRFLVYTLFPEGNISVRLFKAFESNKIVVAAGHNIFKRDSKTNIGMLFSKYGGGGHKGAGTCQIDQDPADERINEIINIMKSDG